jgi:hypothetical protein
LTDRPAGPFFPGNAPSERRRRAVVARSATPIAADKYFLAPRAKRLKNILPKLDPTSTERTVTPYPPPRPSAEPSLLYRKLRGGCGRR